MEKIKKNVRFVRRTASGEIRTMKVQIKNILKNAGFIKNGILYYREENSEECLKKNVR